MKNLQILSLLSGSLLIKSAPPFSMEQYSMPASPLKIRGTPLVKLSKTILIGTHAEYLPQIVRLPDHRPAAELTNHLLML